MVANYRYIFNLPLLIRACVSPSYISVTFTSAWETVTILTTIMFMQDCTTYTLYKHCREHTTIIATLLQHAYYNHTRCSNHAENSCIAGYSCSCTCREKLAQLARYRDHRSCVLGIQPLHM